MTPSPLLRPLQFLAVALGVAILVLGVAWLRMDQPAVRAVEAGARSDAPAAAPLQAATVPPAEPGESAAKEPPTRGASLDATRAVLYGAVRRADGTPVEQGVLWAYRDGRHEGTASVRAGVYSFAGLLAGDCVLKSRIDDELPLHRGVTVRAPATRFDVELPARWLLTVHAVTTAGEPLTEAVSRRMGRGGMTGGPEARALAQPLARDLPLSNHRSVDVGLGPFRAADSFQRLRRPDAALPKETLGVLTLPPGQPVHVALLLRNHVVAQQPVAAGQEEVTFTLDLDAFLAHTATVRVRLVDQGGAPLAKVQVALNDLGTGGGGVRTDADGRATLSHLTPGRLDFEVWRTMLSAPPVFVDVAPGADLDLGEVTLVPPTKAEIAMDNFGGRGSVRYTWLGTPRPGMTVRSHYIDSDSGAVRAVLFYPGRYAMVVAAPNGVASAEVDLRSAPAAPIRFDLRPGAPLRVRMDVGAGFAILELTSAQGAIVRRREFTGAYDEVVKLPPGVYTATVTDQGGAVTRREVALTQKGGTLTLR